MTIAPGRNSIALALDVRGVTMLLTALFITGVLMVVVGTLLVRHEFSS